MPFTRDDGEAPTSMCEWVAADTCFETGTITLVTHAGRERFFCARHARRMVDTGQADEPAAPAPAPKPPTPPHTHTPGNPCC